MAQEISKINAWDDDSTLDPRSPEGQKAVVQSLTQLVFAAGETMRNAKVFNPEDPRSEPPTYSVGRLTESDQ